MVRKVGLLLFALLILLGGPLSAVAQNATPVAGGSAGPAVGDVIPLIGDDGREIGTISVDDIIDPVPVPDASYPPMRGYHYVQAVVTIANTSSGTITVDSSDFLLVDSDGYSTYSSYSYSYSSTSVTSDIQPLMYGDLEAGVSTTGSVTFNLYDESEIDAIYLVTDAVLTPLVDFGGPASPGGEPVSIAGTDGAEMLSITVNDVFDPFMDYSSGSSPDRGYHYIGVDLTIENTGDVPYSIDTSRFMVLDTDGFFAGTAYYVSASDTGTPEFSYQTIAAGESAVGRIYFEALDGTKVAKVLLFNRYSDNSQLIVLADAGDEGFESEPVVLPTAVPPSADCIGIDVWYQTVFDEVVTPLTPTFDALEGLSDTSDADLNPPSLLGAKDAIDAASAKLSDIVVPPAAEEFHAVVLTALDNLSTAVEDLATAADENDTAAIQTARENLEAAIDYIDNDAEAQDLFTDLTTECPELLSVFLS